MFYLKKIVVIGGGFAGCAAAITARKAGAQVTLVEKTDLLLGLGNVGGIMRNNGRYTAAEENIAMGARELFEITDRYSLHKGVDFPGHRHASFFDIIKIEPAVRQLLDDMGVEVRMIARAVDVESEESEVDNKSPNDDKVEAPKERMPHRLKRLIAIKLADGERIEGDVFVEATGSSGPMGGCAEHGRGCSMCVLRCPAFGPRVSISQRAGLPDLVGKRRDGQFGAFSGSGKLEKASLSPELQWQLETEGVAVVPLPPEKIVREKLEQKVCQQYALAEYAENIILIDTGHAKIMTPYFPLEALRTVPGFENARYADPYAGGKGNSIRYLSVAERDNTMKVKGFANLFCGGEKSGLFVGHTEAITTGSLAGHNAVRLLAARNTDNNATRHLAARENTPATRHLTDAGLLQLPRSTAAGDLIAYGNEMIVTEAGLRNRYTFAGDEFFLRMQERDLYTTDVDLIRQRIETAGLLGVYDEIK